MEYFFLFFENEVRSPIRDAYFAKNKHDIELFSKKQTDIYLFIKKKRGANLFIFNMYLSTIEQIKLAIHVT